MGLILVNIKFTLKNIFYCVIIFVKVGDNMGYIEELRKMIGHTPVNLVGSVVIIKNEKNEILLHKRTFPEDTWSFT